ncbi:MAG TPA: DUF4396 domain-containing protein [Stellaceae bacterium]|jgi:hypothetical protein|nr:DUF4396 domain-containing protein [Stellaceae bacterium]
MPPQWVEVLAAVYVPLSVGSALVVLADIYLVGRRQKMAIMEAVWPLTVLYWGCAGLVFYFGFGRSSAAASGERQDPPMAQAAFKGAAHCGAGCALGDFIGDWIVFAAGLRIFGSALGAKYLVAFALAYAFGIGFQYFSIAPMRGLGLGEGLVAAIKADTLSLVAYEVGMFAWMGLRTWLYPELEPTSLPYWLMMQGAMVFGFATTYPVNWWLIRTGVKEKM